jgi:hypothetical protein
MWVILTPIATRRTSQDWTPGGRPAVQRSNEPPDRRTTIVVPAAELREYPADAAGAPI